MRFLPQQMESSSTPTSAPARTSSGDLFGELLLGWSRGQLCLGPSVMLHLLVGACLISARPLSIASSCSVEPQLGEAPVYAGTAGNT